LGAGTLEIPTRMAQIELEHICLREVNISFITLVLVDTSAGGLLVPEDSIHPVVSASAVT